MSERLFGLLENARRQKARRQAIAKDLPDSLASKYESLYEGLRNDGSLIKAGTRISWGEGLKKAAVDLWDNEQSTPDAAPTLWEDIAYYKGYRIIPDVITSTTSFSKDEIGYWQTDGLFYKAVNDGTVWTPEQYSAAWKVIE